MIIVKIEVDGEEVLTVSNEDWDGEEVLTVDNEDWDGEKSTMIYEAITLLRAAEQYRKEGE